MANAELSRRVEKVVGHPPLVEMGDKQRREFREALLDARAFEDLPGKWQAAILKAEQNRPQLASPLATSDSRTISGLTPLKANWGGTAAVAARPRRKGFRAHGALTSALAIPLRCHDRMRLIRVRPVPP